MARTRGGGVIRGASARPRRNADNPSVAGTYGQRFPVAPPVPSATTDIPLGAPNPPLGKNTAAAAESARDLDLFLGFSSEEGAHRFSPQSGGTVATSTGVMTGNPSVMGVLEGSAVGDVNDVLGDDLTPFLDGELGHGVLDIHENFQNAFDMNAEDINDSPLIDSEEESAGSGLLDSDTNEGNRQRPVAVQKSPLTPPKVVWRMLYVDPDVADPKLIAGLLESAASQALGCSCVFDVATDIVEALADIREGVMWVYRGVFINESLLRYRRAVRTQELDRSPIEGKHLARFLRQVGMSRTRMVLLVAGGVDFDTADASAHGLSAVLRKPFTKTGFCNILRGMYLGGEPTPCPETDSSPTMESDQALPQQHQSSTKRPRAAGEEAPLAVVTAAAALGGGSAMMHLGPSIPACLGFTPFTPFTHPMMRTFAPLGQGLLRAGQSQSTHQRKYTKIAPRELHGGGLGLPLHSRLSGKIPPVPKKSRSKGQGGVVGATALAPGGGGGGFAPGAAQEFPLLSSLAGVGRSAESASAAPMPEAPR